MKKVDFIPGLQRCFKIWKSVYIVHHINKLKNVKTLDHLNRCRKDIWQNPVSIPDKNSQQSQNRGEIPQSDKRHL